MIGENRNPSSYRMPKPVSWVTCNGIHKLNSDGAVNQLTSNGGAVAVLRGLAGKFIWAVGEKNLQHIGH